MPVLHPPALPKTLGLPLLEVADRIAQLKPWEFFHDVDLIGVRDDTTGDLRVACILGGLQEVFGVLIHRHDAGRRYLYETVNDTTLAFEEGLEDIDYLKVEWTNKLGLGPGDQETLRLSGRTPRKGEKYPRFEAAQPGWHPWGLKPDEAKQMESDLRKVLRIVRLRQKLPDLFVPQQGFRIAVVPAGDEFTLQPEDLQWEMLVAKPRVALEPIQFPSHYLENFRTLPQRPDLAVQFLAPLLPEMSFIDKAARRPCFARLGLIVDPDTGIVAQQIAHGGEPVWHCAAQCLEKMFLNLAERPSSIQVDRPLFADMLAPACSPLGIRIDVLDTLPAAEGAYLAVTEGIGEVEPR